MLPKHSAESHPRRIVMLAAVAALHCACAACAGEPPGAAEYERARHFSGATGMAIDEQKAMVSLQRSAEIGYLPAQVDVSFVYLNGKGLTTKDLSKSFFWFRKAAGQGSRIAQCMLGDFYRDGLGGAQQSDAQALKWYRLTATSSDRCSPRSQFQLYKAYETGRGVPKDLKHAIVWLKKSAEAGNPVAQIALGRSYLKGYGVSRDEHLGRAWLKRSREGVAPHDDEEEDAHAPGSSHVEKH